MAQTTRLASFGPIFIVATHPSFPHAFETSTEPKYSRNNELAHTKDKEKRPT